ncbi:MAG: glycosyltransferase family 4 protein [Planctomycetes bacterium]|nr:glycosyltransferase family 4 protein [Planctomycetota bacterium]
MNIWHVITRLIVGGAQENTVLTCRGLVERGHCVTLVAGPQTGPEGSLWNEAEHCGARLVRLASLRRAVHPWHDWRALRELTALLRRHKPDILHTHSSKAGILGRHAAARAQVPIVVHTIHGMSFNRTQAAAVRFAYRLLERRAARHTHAFVSVADAMTDQAVAAGIAPRERFTTIRSGVEAHRFAPSAEARQRLRGQWGVGDEHVVVGTIARLFVNKGYEELLAAMPRAVAAAPGLRFVWIGDGAHRGRYERALERFGLQQRVTLLGLLPPARVAEVLPAFDLLVHASRWEGLPRAVVQGLLCEVPAISFDNDGAPEVVVPGETGIIVPYGDTAGLADALVTLARDADLRRRLGQQGRQRCLTEFDAGRMVEEIERLYLRLSGVAR